MGERDRQVRRVLWIVLGLNVAVAATKLVVGALTGSLAVMADGVHAVLDGSSNVVGLVGLWLASRPADEDHPYGHRRFETLTAAVIGLLILAGLLGVGSSLVATVRLGRTSAEPSWGSAAVVLLTIVANLVISRYEASRGRALRSSILVADAGHTLSDALGAVAVLASFGGIALGWWWADAAAAAIVMVLIARTAFQVLRAALGVLVDEVRLDPEGIRRVALAVSDVRGAHKIRSRGSLDHVHVDLHIHVDPTMTVAHAHEVTHRVADAVRGAFPEVADVVIHTEPADGRESRPAPPGPVAPSSAAERAQS